MNTWAWSAKDEKSPLGIIKKTLIAWILIQASWFLVAALVDVSTVATYAVWGLPLSILKDTTIGNQKILAVNSSLDLNKFYIDSAGGEDFQVWYSTKHTDKEITMSPCRVEHGFVIWREYGDTKYKNKDTLNSLSEFAGKNLEICVLFGNQLVMWPEDDLFAAITTEVAQYPPADPAQTPSTYTTETKASYKEWMNALLNLTWWDRNANITGKFVYISWWVQWFLDGNTFFDGSNSLTIASLIQRSKWFVWPLVTIYSSLLNFAQLTDTNITTTSWTSGIFIIKALVALALFFPLIALSLVLIARIWVLWLYIVASPFIILKESFKNLIKIKWLDEYLSLNGVIGIIFAPVITVAALSISLIFMTTLVNGFSSSDTSSAINETIGIQKIEAQDKNKNDAVSIGWVTQLEFSKLPWWEAMDWFSWLMVNFFAIGLMWMIFFAALKANELGKSIGSKVESFGTKFFQTLPILPIGENGKGVGIRSASNVLGNVPDRWISDRESEQSRIANEFVYGPDENESAPKTISTEQASEFINTNATQASIEEAVQKLWVQKWEIGSVLSTSTTSLYEAIDKINGIDETKKIELAWFIAGASWGKLWEDWYTQVAKTKAMKDLDTFVNSKNPTDQNTLSTIFTAATPEQKKIIENYFTTTRGNTYIFTIGNTQYTVHRNVSTTTPPVISYTVSTP